jgi:hypothetical protein
VIAPCRGAALRCGPGRSAATLLKLRQHSAAEPQPNDEGERPPPVDDLGVETLCLRGPREMLQNMFAKNTRNYGIAMQGSPWPGEGTTD